MGFTCLYSGKKFDDAQRSPEHVIPFAAGGSDAFVVNNVARNVNNKIGVEVDEPFCRSWLVESARSLHKITDKFGNIPPFRMPGGMMEVGGELRDVTAKYEKGAWDMRIKNAKSESIDPSTGAKTVSLAALGNTDGIVAKLAARAARDGKKLDMQSIREELIVGPKVHATMTLDLLDYHRMFTKFLLGTGSFFLGEDFSDVPVAGQLRRMLTAKSLPDFEAQGEGLRGTFWNQPCSLPPELFTPPTKHLAAAFKTAGSIYLHVSFMGQFSSGLVLGPEFVHKISDDFGEVMVIDPVTHRGERGSLGRLRPGGRLS